MAREKFGDFEWDTDKDTKSVLEDHSKYMTKKISASKELEFKEREAQLEKQGNTKKENELFTNSITDEANRKLVGTLIEKGFDKETITKEFPHLVPKPADNPQPDNNGGKMFDINSVIKEHQQELTKSLANKSVSEMTPLEQEIWIQQNAERLNNRK